MLDELRVQVSHYAHHAAALLLSLAEQDLPSNQHKKSKDDSEDHITNRLLTIQGICHCKNKPCHH